MTLYRMAEPCHNMDADFLKAMKALDVRIVDMANAPYNVIFEGTQEALVKLYDDEWGTQEDRPNIFEARQMPCAEVRRLYEVRIDFEYPEPEACDSELIDNALFTVLFKFETEDTDFFHGNPACSPYLTAWTLDEMQAHQLGRALVDRLIKLGCKVTS